MVVMAAMMICLGASAIDKVVKKATLTGEVTSLEDLKASTFLLANGEGAETVVLYIPDGWDFKVGKPSVLSGSTGQGAYYKLEALGDNYQVPVFNIDKNARTGWWGSAYLNSQPKGGSVIFGLSGTNDQKGQDGPNLAVWTITYEEAKGFAFKCVGRDDADIYVGHDGTAARPVTEITYWKAYTGFESAYDAAEVEAAAKAVEAAVKTSDAKAAFADAKAAYEADNDLDAYVKAINAAVDVINTCEQVNKAYANYKLSTLGAAAVKAVVDKYNAGEYKDVAALGAAYVEAVKAQNCDGADMTGAIVNPSFELGTIEGWTSENCGNVANNYNFGGRTGDKFCERWQGSGGLSNGKFYQALTGLPNGTYKVTADLQNREQGNGDAAGKGFYVFANEDRTEGLDANNGKTIEVTTEIADGNLTLGVQLDGCTGNWICFDNFTLTLVKAANAIVPEKDAWYTGADFFRFRADKNASAESPYIAYKDKVEPAWGAAAGEETNGCIVCKVPANVNPASQLWIRGTEAGKTIANGSKDGFKVTFRVKADGEYKGLESQAHNGWGYKTGGSPFGTLDVTTEWQTVSFICTGEKAKADFTDLCFNLSGDTERTFYFDDVQISRGSEWYLNNEFHAKDYQDPTATYSDGANPHPAARFVSDAEGGYVEVISNANAGQTYNSQLWIAIPEKYVGGSTKMTMEVQASKAIKCPESFQATATGNGWGCNPGPGSGVEFKVGEWTTVERILKTKGVKSTGTWRDRQADQYCLDLSENTGDKEAITYKFRNVKFEDAAEPWTETMTYNVKVTPFTQDPADETKWVAGADESHAPEYNFGTGGEEGGYFEVQVNGKKANPWDTQFFFQIADVAPSKELKVNETVNLKFKVKALATETLVAGTELSLDGGFHVSNDGAGWVAGAPAAAIKVGEWSPVELKLDIAKYDKGIPTNYSINLTMDANPITYLIDEVEATWAEAPVLDWVELISNGDCEAAPEHTFAASKEVPVDGSNTNKSRVVEGVGKDGSKGIEVVAGAKTADPWDNQFWIYEPYALPAGTNIIVEFDYKADLAGSVGTQSHNAPGGYLHWAAIGNTNFTTEWQHFKYEGKIASECDDNGTARFRSIAFNLNDIADANKYYFDNISFKVPAGTIDGLEPVYIDDYKEVEYIDPATLVFTDNLFTNGDIEGEDMSAFIAKVNDDADGLLLPAGSKTFKGSNQILVKSVAREKDPADETKYLGNDHDTQFFVRLPYALPQGTTFFFSVDYLSNKVATIPSQTHAEPGQWKGNKGVGSITTGSDAQTLSGYFKAEADMRSIAFNLAAATEGGQFYFDNFVFKVVKDDEAAIKEFTATWDGTSTWNETFALNQAVDAGRTADTEGCSEESVQALNDAIAAGKAELANAEATKETLAAAAKAIEDALAALRGGEGEYLPKPETDPDYANFVEIPQDQGKDLDTFARTAVEEGADFNTYTASGDLQVAFKMYDIDVAGCDYVTVKFAQPAPKGWNIAFWAQGGTDNVEIPEGATEYKYVFADDAKCAIKDDVLPQICVLTLWPGGYPFDMKVYGIYKHKVATVEDTDLTKEMFFTWDGVGADAEATAQAGCAYDINTSTGMPYGDGTVNEYNYADLSAYDHLAITAAEGEPRLLFNRAAQDDHQGPLSVELPRDKGQNKYEAVVENTDGSKTYVINLKEIVAKDGYAHLHAIKGANWANTTVTEMKLFAGSSQYTDVLTNIFEVADDAAVKDGKYFINGQIVIVKDGVKYNAAGLPIE